MTAAPTTAALATGDGPGETAAPTTAALATGDGPGVTAAVTTAALATRDGRSGMSGSLCRKSGFVRLDGGDDGLDGDPAVGDQLPARMADGGPERGGPQVLVDEHRADAAGRHRGAEV